MAEEDKNMNAFQSETKVDNSKAERIDTVISNLFIPPLSPEEEAEFLEQNQKGFGKKPYRSRRKR